MARLAARSTSRMAGTLLAMSIVTSVSLLAIDVVATDVSLPGRIGSGGSGVPAASPAAAADGDQLVAPSAPTVPAQGNPDMSNWASIAASSMDNTTLEAGGVTVPWGGNVFAARIVDGGPSPAYDLYEAGGGAFANGFYPASSIKLFAALAALEYVGKYGFSGAATIDGGYTVYDTYNAALEYSSNEDYSALVRIAGVEWLNTVFLPEHGYQATTIQEPYGDDEQVAYSPEMVLDEAGQEATLPEREGYDDYGCDGSNCSTLFEMTDAIRRVVMDGEIPTAERFTLFPDDVTGLQQSLHDAESWIAPGVANVFGADAPIYSKPGYVGGLDCVDTALVIDPATGNRYLIGLTAPDDDGCDMLATMAQDVLTVLKDRTETAAIRTDGSVVKVVDGRQAPGTP